MKQGYKVGLLVLLVLLIDQATKFYIKTHFEYNQDVLMFGADWARLHFVENEGMAFGIKFDWQYGKLALSLFRILMVAGLIWYIRMLIQAKVPMGFVYSVGLITAGAVGNIIDSAVYGLIFSESPYHGGTAQLVPWGQGYAPFLHGKVVDMLYFPMKWIHMPEWMPMVGGEDYLFFSPIFNVADAAITTGVLFILLFQRRFFRDALEQTPPAADAVNIPVSDEAVDADMEATASETENPASETDQPEPETADHTPATPEDTPMETPPGDIPADTTLPQAEGPNTPS